MIGSGSSIDKLFYNAFQWMKLPTYRLMLVQSPLYSFNGEVVVFEGIITLPVTLGIAFRYLNLMIDFIVVKVPLAYNMILCRPCIRMAKVVLSTYHLVMKFPIEASAREVRGNQVMARKCYFTAIKGKQKAKEMFTASLHNFAK